MLLLISGVLPPQAPPPSPPPQSQKPEAPNGCQGWMWFISLPLLCVVAISVVARIGEDSPLLEPLPSIIERIEVKPTSPDDAIGDHCDEIIARAEEALSRMEAGKPQPSGQVMLDDTEALFEACASCRERIEKILSPADLDCERLLALWNSSK